MLGPPGGLGHEGGSGPLKRVRIGPLAFAAAAQWQLDRRAVEAWATTKGLPGVGIAELLAYRREHPEEDLAADLAECDLAADDGRCSG